MNDTTGKHVDELKDGTGPGDEPWQMPAEWQSEHKLFTHQVGFTCPPYDWDAAPSDFLRMSPESVGVHGWMLHAPDYRHQIVQRKQKFQLLEEFVHCMANNGADVCGQVGSNWVHASGLGVEGISDFCKRLEDKHGLALHMAGFSLVEALRELGAERVALNAVYHWPQWWQGTKGFLEEAGFEVLWAGNFVDQGWFSTQDECNAQRWVFDAELAQKSFDFVADKAPDADVYLANGMCNFRSGPEGLPQRMLHQTEQLESRLGKPVVAHDTALYWRIFKTLGIKPQCRSAGDSSGLGKLLDSL